MATAVAQSSKPDSAIDLSNITDQIFGFLDHPGIITLLIIGGLCLLVIILVGGWFIRKFIKDDQERVQEDGNLRKYRELKQSCIHNQNMKLIKKEWSPLNLIFYFPLIIPGIITQFAPVFKKDRSIKILDNNNNFLGFYRGHTIDNGELLLAFYKKKSFFIFEDIKVIRCLLEFDYEKILMDKDGNILYDVNEDGMKIEKKVIVKEKKYKNLVRYIGWNNEKVNNLSLAKSIHIMCDGLKIIDHYYFVPNYIFLDGDKNIVYKDFTEEFSQNTVKRTTQKILEDTLSRQTKIVDSSAQSNPEIAKERHKIEKTEIENENEQN